MTEETSRSPERNLIGLLLDPHEELEVEYKSWLNLKQSESRADLAQAILALANHGGGYIVVGFSESDTGWHPDQARPDGLDGYNQDAVNGIVQRYADPAFHVEVHLVVHPDLNVRFPVIVVPGGHRIPIRAKRGGPDGAHVKRDSYYIRRPGPSSEPPQTADEWRLLIGRCVTAGREELLEAVADLIAGRERPQPPPERPLDLDDWAQECRARFQHLVGTELGDEEPHRYSPGVWSVAYKVDGDFERPTLSGLLDLLRSVKGHESGWPPWLILSREGNEPYSFEGTVECWLRNTLSQSGRTSDFWRATPDGRFYLVRGYQEDEIDEAGKSFDLVFPVWRVGECLLHASRMAHALGVSDGTIAMLVKWEGLRGRTLRSRGNPDRILFVNRVSRQDEAAGRLSARADTIPAKLPELVLGITRAAYESFGFFLPPKDMYEEELARMRGR